MELDAGCGALVPVLGADCNGTDVPRCHCFGESQLSQRRKRDPLRRTKQRPLVVKIDQLRLHCQRTLATAVLPPNREKDVQRNRLAMWRSGAPEAGSPQFPGEARHASRCRMRRGEPDCCEAVGKGRPRWLNVRGCCLPRDGTANWSIRSSDCVDCHRRGSAVRR